MSDFLYVLAGQLPTDDNNLAARSGMLVGFVVLLFGLAGLALWIGQRAERRSGDAEMARLMNRSKKSKSGADDPEVGTDWLRDAGSFEDEGFGGFDASPYLSGRTDEFGQEIAVEAASAPVSKVPVAANPGYAQKRPSRIAKPDYVAPGAAVVAAPVAAPLATPPAAYLSGSALEADGLADEPTLAPEPSVTAEPEATFTEFTAEGSWPFGTFGEADDQSWAMTEDVEPAAPDAIQPITAVPPVPEVVPVVPVVPVVAVTSVPPVAQTPRYVAPVVAPLAAPDAPVKPQSYTPANYDPKGAAPEATAWDTDGDGGMDWWQEAADSDD